MNIIAAGIAIVFVSVSLVLLLISGVMLLQVEKGINALVKKEMECWNGESDR